MLILHASFPGLWVVCNKSLRRACAARNIPPVVNPSATLEEDGDEELPFALRMVTLKTFLRILKSERDVGNLKICDVWRRFDAAAETRESPGGREP